MTTREARIEQALRNLLMSADCTWEQRRLGHDWAEACESARAALASPPLAAEPRRDEIATTLAAIVSHYRNGYEPALFVSVIAGFIDVAEVVLRERPAPPLAAEGTAGPDLAEIELLLGELCAASSCCGYATLTAANLDRERAAKERLLIAIRALASPVAPREETPATPNSSNEEA
jgi:hypothetical protein